MLKRTIDQYDINGNLIRSHESYNTAADYIGVSGGSLIHRAVNENIIAYGFKWKLSDQEHYAYKIPSVNEKDIPFFVERIKNKKDLIYWYIYSKPYIKEHEVEDYYQEIVAYLWKDYDWFLKEFKGTFDTYFNLQMKRAVGGYAKKIYRYKVKENCTENFSYFSDAYEEYKEDEQIAGMAKAIEDIEERDREIINLWLEDVDLTALSIKHGKNKSYYSGRIDIVKKKIYNNRHKYFSGVLLKEKQPSKTSLFLMNRAPTKISPILQYDISGTNLIARYESVKQAAELTGFQATNISNAARGAALHYRGYKWKYAASEN